MTGFFEKGRWIDGIILSKDDPKELENQLERVAELLSIKPCPDTKLCYVAIKGKGDNYYSLLDIIEAFLRRIQ